MNLFSRIGLWLAGSAFLVFLCAGFVSRMNFKLKRVSLLLGTGAWLFFVFSVTLNGPYSAERFHNWNLIPFQGIGEIAGAFQSRKVNGFYLTPVSYTHLDVYKRQHDGSGTSGRLLNNGE